MARGCSTSCGPGSGSTARSAGSRPAAGSTGNAWSGCCSRWWPPGRLPHRRSWRRPGGSPDDVHVPGLPDVDADACYRAMDFLLETLDELQESVFFTAADLLSLDVDLIFFDTISTYFELEFDDGELDDTDDGCGGGATPRTPVRTCPRS